MTSSLACPVCGHVDKRGWENPEGCGEVFSSIGPLRCGINTTELCSVCRRKRAPKPPPVHDAACDCSECRWILKGEGLWFSRDPEPGYQFGPLDQSLCAYPEKKKAFVDKALQRAQAKIDAKFEQDPADRKRRHEAWLKWWRSW